MPPRLTTYGGGPQVTQDQINRTAIPDRIKCQRCGKVKEQSFFSTKQLEVIRGKIAQWGPSGAIKSGWGNCRICTGSQVSELHCILCNETKGLDDFAKTHRKNPDAAKCRDCMDTQVNVTPVEAVGTTIKRRDLDEDSEVSNPFAGQSAIGDEPEHEGEGSTGGVSLGLSKLSLDGKENTNVTGGSNANRTPSFAPSGWVVQQRHKKFGSSSQHSTVDSTFDPNAYRKPHSPASISGSVRSNKSSATLKTSPSGWAKVPKSVKEEPQASDDEDWEPQIHTRDDSDDSD